MSLETDPKNDLWTFREGRRTVAGAALRADLLRVATAFCARPEDGRLALSALISAGEFETGVADANSPACVSCQQLTDALASAFVGDTSEIQHIRSLLEKIDRSEIPEHLSSSPPEGFAYYALHPFDFARLAEKVANNRDSALVIGIRSIGTTLGAIVCAALKKQGRNTKRITVRPSGHPYERVLDFSPVELQEIARWNSREADFVVVDEGPGRSGSSFLSVAEALLKAGVPRNRITLLGSRPVDVNQLCAPNARERWTQFTFFWPDPFVYTRFSNHLYIAGGNWRDLFWKNQATWPACWPQMERLKFLSPDRQSIFKFEGFGRFGEEVLSRAQMLAQGGFGCQAEDAGDGMIRYPVIEGFPASTQDISRKLLTRVADYCAFRAVQFPSPASATSQLPGMLRFNTQQEFGIELGQDIDGLYTSKPILPDGRMQPYEWIRQPDGTLLKVDAYTHGDDHFFPGPTDVAWDLAGAVVEWNLDNPAADFFLSQFRRSSGLDRARILPLFTLAYTVFRSAYCKMALSTVKGCAEEPRIYAAYGRYRDRAERQLREMGLLNSSAMKSPCPAATLDPPIQPGTAA